MADRDPGEPSSALTAWRAATLGSLIAWDLACAAVAAILLTWLGAGREGYRGPLAGGWALVAILAALLLARRLEWRTRAVVFLCVNYLVILLTARSSTPGPVAFSHAAAVVALAGLLLGGRAAAGAAVLVMGTLSAMAVAVGAGWATVRPPLDPAVEWMAALAGGFPPLVMVVLALYWIVDRLRDALSSTTRTLHELEATRSQVADSERAELAGRLATALAHDLNNTLTVVVAGAEWLAERLQRGEEAEAAAQVCEAAQNASALTQQVLLASGSGRSSQPRTIDLARVAAVAASALRRLLPPDIRVETRVDGPVWTVLDPGQLQQIVLGLALNARAAMPGGGTLLLAVRPGGAPPASPAEPPPAAILEISDTGFGMDAEERRRAFEPLPDRSGRRLGVSLSGVKGLVEAAGGQVLLRSRPGTGTVITLTLPGALPATAGPAPGPARPARVLVVEDDIRVRALVCTALSESGHDVSEVSDGTQAMRAIEELGGIELLVTDVVIPGAPIGEVIATFHSRHPTGSVLLCSAFSQDEALRQRGVGRHRLLRKPFTRGELLAEVQAVLAEAAAGDRAPAARTGVRA